jgi:UDP-arabinose 4-epimerase
VTDLVDAHVLGLQHLNNPPDVFNVGTGRGVSVREFVHACQAVVGKPIRVVEEARPRDGDYAEVRQSAKVLWLHLHRRLVSKMV